MKSDALRIVQEDCERVVQGYISDLELLKGTNVFITGGSGFMGSWLTETIFFLNDKLKFGIKLYLVSRDISIYEEKHQNLAQKPYVSIIRCDVKNLTDIPKDVNYIIHAAGVPDSRFHSSRPLETMITIAEGTRSVLSAADRVSNLKMMLNVSSGNVYGAGTNQLSSFPETYQGIIRSGDLTSVYAEAKRYAETLCTAARNQARLPVTTVRPFTFIGPYQPLDAPWAINNFFNDAINNRPIRILGDGNTIRGLMYGADMALWILVILTKTQPGKFYNIGNDQGMTLIEMAKEVASHFQPMPDIILNASIGVVTPKSVAVPDTTAARKDFNLKQLTDTKTSIKKTLKWYQAWK